MERLIMDDMERKQPVMDKNNVQRMDGNKLPKQVNGYLWGNEREEDQE